MEQQPVMNNLDLVCQLESRSVAPFCGQRINPRYIPAELLQKAIQMPMATARIVFDNYIRDVRFSCHNCIASYFFWVIFWLFLSSMFWTGYMFLWVSDAYRDSRYNPRNFERDFGLFLTMPFVGLLGLQVACCVCCKSWRRPHVDQQLASVNSVIAPYKCLATVTNSRYGFSFYLTFYYYNIDPCVAHLAQSLQATPPQMPYAIHMSGLQQQQQQQLQLHHQQQQQQQQQPGQQNIYQEQARSLILTHSPAYLRQFREESLPEVIVPRHARQTVCLCQYVESKKAPRGMRMSPSAFVSNADVV